jgi:hypothetical protein
MQRLLSWGVDAIISDRPDVAVSIVHPGRMSAAQDSRRP